MLLFSRPFEWDVQIWANSTFFFIVSKGGTKGKNLKNQKKQKNAAKCANGPFCAFPLLKLSLHFQIQLNVYFSQSWPILGDWAKCALPHSTVIVGMLLCTYCSDINVYIFKLSWLYTFSNSAECLPFSKSANFRQLSPMCTAVLSCRSRHAAVHIMQYALQ